MSHVTGLGPVQAGGDLHEMRIDRKAHDGTYGRPRPEFFDIPYPVPVPPCGVVCGYEYDYESNKVRRPWPGLGPPEHQAVASRDVLARVLAAQRQRRQVHMCPAATRVAPNLIVRLCTRAMSPASLARCTPMRRTPLAPHHVPARLPHQLLNLLQIQDTYSDEEDFWEYRVHLYDPRSVVASGARSNWSRTLESM